MIITLENNKNNYGGFHPLIKSEKNAITKKEMRKKMKKISIQREENIQLKS